MVAVTIILLAPDTLALVAAIAVATGHMHGASTWVLWNYAHGYQITGAMFLLTATMLGVGIRYGWRPTPGEAYAVPFLSNRARTTIAVVLFVFAVLVSLWPVK